MKIPFKEPTAPRYIYINPVSNTVHLLMPIMSGTEIGLDNTCMSVYSLQEFFGLLGANQQSTALGVLTDYKASLEFDLKYMPASEETARKAHRLSQIDTYLDILQHVQQDTLITEPLKQAFPLYPEPLVHLMQTSEANLHSVILRPREQDNYLRTTAIAPTFSANHNQMENGQLLTYDSQLANTLRHHYHGVSLTPKSKEDLIARVVSNRAGLPVDFNQIKAALINEIQTYLGMAVNFDATQGKRLTPSVPMNQPYLDEQLGIDEDNPATTEDYVNGLIEFCTPNLFDNLEDSPFYTANDAEHLSILTQFFLAELNIVCREHGITVTNFGQILERDTKLTEDLALAVKQALEQSTSVEDTLIQYLNQHQQRFELTTLIAEASVSTLKERFKSHWKQIKASPHFDEFMLLGEQNGLFVTHQGCMATHFASFLQMGWQDSRLDVQLQDFSAVNKTNNLIPHKNEHIHADMQAIELDLSQMDKDALQALYEDINTEANATLKEALLTQFKQERPDFKPKIDAKKFLQHVAYGEQNEAEALLQQDPELAQELLQADNIPFTDYSGRTFNCTAYEYAYWAKDTHMQRMLEKYIRINDETSALILGRVQAIEQLVSPGPDSGLFAHPTPRGLRYTTKDQIEHQDTGFDLTPLINALNHYVTEYNRIPHKTEADWEALDNIWVEEVGRAQRDIPAHIAHEYCHPERSFEAVNNNNELLNAANPRNLKRQLKFYNVDTGNDDLWLSPGSYSIASGLGFSFGILRGPRGGSDGGAPWLRRLWRWGMQATMDSVALTTIDKVRTNDREQSLLNLSQPLNQQASQSHGL